MPACPTRRPPGQAVNTSAPPSLLENTGDSASTPADFCNKICQKQTQRAVASTRLTILRRASSSATSGAVDKELHSELSVRFFKVRIAIGPSYGAAAMASLISIRKPRAAGLYLPRPFFPVRSAASLMMS